VGGDRRTIFRNFPSKRGAKAFSARLAFGALLIKEKLTLSDDETVAIIAETPAMQYFVGFEKFLQKAPFDPSSLVYFRKRFDAQFIDDINQIVIQKGRKKSISSSSDQEPPDSDNPGSDSKETHQGKLIIDATCAPADIHYPTDLALLNKAREKSEEIIDQLHFHESERRKKPRTYRKKARKQFLALARRKRLILNEIRKGRSQQLNYLKRNLGHIAHLSIEVSLGNLSRVQYKNLLVIHEVFRQQEILHTTRGKSIANRIVSISQPHIRTFVRGKAKAPTEFGAKLSASVCDQGFVTLDRIDWEAYNECGDLEAQAEKYKARTGTYPKSVLADKIYRTRENRKWCKEHGIRLCGQPPGRPPSDESIRKKQRLQLSQDERERNSIEGKFGQAKRRFGLGRIMSKLQGTSECTIALSFLVMNLVKLSELFIYLFFSKNILLSLLNYPEKLQKRDLKIKSGQDACFGKFLPRALLQIQVVESS
jgi:transposase, IS5 family